MRPEIDRRGLKQAYLQSPSAREADTFVLYRILGNDLTPRHGEGQTRENLRFILEHEAELFDCEKRFVVNRIVDPEEEALLLRMLDATGLSYIHIPFHRDEYAKMEWDSEGVPAEFAPCSDGFETLTPEQQGRILMRIHRHKNNYVMNNNGARNAALSQGKQLAKWILPWDGNCFLTTGAWKEIVTTVRASPELGYFATPMARITDNRQLLDASFLPTAVEEPQLIFRRNSRLTFDESYFYGRRPKVELLWRLGIPGEWDHWHFEPWDLPCPRYASEAGEFAFAGWVARLNSGQPQLEVDPVRGSIDRGLARAQAVVGMLKRLDARRTLSEQ